MDTSRGNSEQLEGGGLLGVLCLAREGREKKGVFMGLIPRSFASVRILRHNSEQGVQHTFDFPLTDFFPPGPGEEHKHLTVAQDGNDISSCIYICSQNNHGVRASRTGNINETGHRAATISLMSDLQFWGSGGSCFLAFHGVWIRGQYGGGTWKLSMRGG